jgi:pimeloyl-ACP methyl ester carboxylesterase
MRWLFLLVFAALVGAAAAQTSGPSPLTRIGVGKTDISLSWDSPLPGPFTVQYQDSLADRIWRIPVESAYPIASNQWSGAARTGARFFRVLPVSQAQRGTLLSVTNAEVFPAALLALVFQAQGIPIVPKYDVLGYRLAYETIDPLGGRTRASGALLLPVNVGAPLPLVSYQHGTIAQTNEAPSSMSILTEAGVGVAFATSGYAAVVPDYLGLGESPGLHPYHHARSEASACVDMLRAARVFCQTNGVPLDDRLFLCGYSQGGHATMALLREIETFHQVEFPVTACAAMAGAYDLAGVTVEDFLSSRIQPNPYYFLYLLGAYQSVYHLAPSLADLFAPPYDTKLPPLLNGATPEDSINAAMPGTPSLVLKPQVLAEFRANPGHPLRLALEDNTLIHWRPASPLRLYHCAADDNVAFANSQVALNSFHKQGAAQVQLIDPMPTANHTGCALPALKAAKDWFDTLR